MENINKTSNQKPHYSFIQRLIDLHNKIVLWQAKLPGNALNPIPLQKKNANNSSRQKTRHPFIQGLIELHDKLLLWQTKQWNGKPPQRTFPLQQKNELAHTFDPPTPLAIFPMEPRKELDSWAHDPMNPASPESFAAKNSDGTYPGGVHPADPTLSLDRSY